MKKIFATDLDGTLLRKDNTISSNTKQGIKNVISKKSYFVISSGRPPYRVKEIIDDLDIKSKEQYMILFNGALVISTDLSKIVYETNLSNNDVNDLIDLAEKIGAKVLLYLIDKIIADEIIEDLSFLKRLSCVVIDSNGKDGLRRYKNVFKMIYTGTKEEIIRFKQLIPNSYKQRFNFVQSGSNYLEIVGINVSKGTALKILAKKLDVDIINCIAIGDQENDIEMIQTAGIGCAVSNAIDKVKNIADYISSSNDEDGVLEAMNKYILG